MLENLGDQDSIGKSGSFLGLPSFHSNLLVDKFRGINLLFLKIIVHQVDHVHVHVKLVVVGQQVLCKDLIQNFSLWVA